MVAHLVDQSFSWSSRLERELWLWRLKMYGLAPAYRVWRSWEYILRRRRLAGMRLAQAEKRLSRF